MNNNVAIKVSHISKSFRVPHEKHNSLKDTAVHIFGPRSFTEFNALDDIDFEVKKGEFFGIVGKNGSGKSTLLKILANIYQPSGGSVKINGSLAPFIELGVGFNPELTGRENVFLSGTILGLTRKRIEFLYDEIVSFAEIEEFMDQKLKNYSTGMQVRLAFSIAVRAEADILLIDEVLAVGDAAFQAKCYNYFYELKESKRTIVFVSHDMESIKKYCDRAVYIQDSKVVALGSPSEVASIYSKKNFVDLTDDKHSKEKQADVYLDKIVVENVEKNTYQTGEKIVLKYYVMSKIKTEVVLGASILAEADRYIAGYNTLKDLGKIQINKGKSIFKITIPADQFSSGMYKAAGAIMTPRDLQLISDNLNGPSFQVINSTDYSDGIFNIQARWSKD